jgi:hypothetical protein
LYSPDPSAQVQRSGFATAFFFNELVDTTGGVERVREYLLTADALIRAPVGEFTLRSEIAEPIGAASELLVMPEFESRWLHRESIGVSLMGTDDLHRHARRKQWRWTIQQVTDGIAARAGDIAVIGPQPVSGFVLGHLVEPPNLSRPLSMAVGQVVRDQDRIWVTGSLPDGMNGGPVFVLLPRASNAGVLRCLGLVLPGEHNTHPIATFDQIRAAIADVPPSRLPSTHSL